MINKLLESTDIKIGEFQKMIGVNANSWGKFMHGKYKDPWSATQNGTYFAAAYFFYRERKLGKHALGKTAAESTRICRDAGAGSVDAVRVVQQLYEGVGRLWRARQPVLPPGRRPRRAAAPGDRQGQVEEAQGARGGGRRRHRRQPLGRPKARARPARQVLDARGRAVPHDQRQPRPERLRLNAASDARDGERRWPVRTRHRESRLTHVCTPCVYCLRAMGSALFDAPPLSS
mmetsp:Transcript_20967/g.67644  ORF Transcript_20967/g.67644 Transcript_20967/m.67644 type:complete len:232 (-) Transcript_20967:176-871(-)